MAMLAQKSLLKAGASVLALAGMIVKLKSKFSEDGTKKAKKGYEKAANTKKENNKLVKKSIEQVTEKKAPQPFGAPVGEDANVPVTAENSQTNIPIDEDVKGLIQVKRKNALRVAAGSKSQKSYQWIKAKLTGNFATEHNIDDVWRGINLDPTIDDKMIRKAGLTKTQILEMWEETENKGYNALAGLFAKNDADQYGLAASEEDPDMREKFGPLLSEYIRAKADGRTLEEKYNEYWNQENFQNDEEETYEVWQEEQEFTDKEKEAQGIIF